jgi:hypothetical protein
MNEIFTSSLAPPSDVATVRMLLGISMTTSIVSLNNLKSFPVLAMTVEPYYKINEQKRESEQVLSSPQHHHSSYNI